MTREQAQQTLLLYRPGSADALDPEVAQALELAKQDPELGRWLAHHQAFQESVRSRLRQIPVPEAQKAATLRAMMRSRLADTADKPAVEPAADLNSGKILSGPASWWRSREWLAVAAVLVLLLGIAALWALRPGPPDRFRHYERMMVSTALRGYNMECETNEMRQLRQYFTTKGAPADYHVTPGLGKLQLLGGTALTWRSHPVAMVCFGRPDNQKIWLFVLNRSALKDPPAVSPAESVVGPLMTASWTEGDKAYIVAGPPEPGFMKKYL